MNRRPINSFAINSVFPTFASNGKADVVLIGDANGGKRQDAIGRLDIQLSAYGSGGRWVVGTPTPAGIELSVDALAGLIVRGKGFVDVEISATSESKVTYASKATPASIVITTGGNGKNAVVGHAQAANILVKSVGDGSLVIAGLAEPAAIALISQAKGQIAVTGQGINAPISVDLSGSGHLVFKQSGEAHIDLKAQGVGNTIYFFTGVPAKIKINAQAKDNIIARPKAKADITLFTNGSGQVALTSDAYALIRLDGFSGIPRPNIPSDEYRPTLRKRELIVPEEKRVFIVSKDNSVDVQHEERTLSPVSEKRTI